MTHFQQNKYLAGVRKMVDKADFTIVSVAYGSNYAKFVPGWWDSIQKLEIKPKEIIIVHNPNDQTGVRDLPVTLIPNESNDITKMMNIGFQNAQTKWMGSLSLDDRYFPRALGDVNSASNFDIIGCTAISKKSGKFLKSDLSGLQTGSNQMLGFSFFTQELYYRVGGWPEIYWSDWAFWWLCLKAGASFCLPPGPHVLVDDLSLERLSSDKNSQADLEMTKFMIQEN
jgi:hypothetical protein